MSLPSSNLRVLVVDDNAINRQVALMMLKKLGVEAAEASSGREALETLERKFYDLILMDVQMPRMDGLETTQRIRQILSRNRPIIVAVTADGDRTECIAAGMDDHIAKPITVKALKSILESYKVVSNRRGD